MRVVFQSTPGRAIRLNDAAVQCTARVFGFHNRNDAISFDVQRSIVTRLTLAQQANVQFLHTLGAGIYVYVFGDRIGTITLSGLSFACACDDELGGAEGTYTWYRINRTSNRPGPLRLMLGSTPIDGFVTGFTEDVVDPSTSLVQWGVTIMTLPDDA